MDFHTSCWIIIYAFQTQHLHPHMHHNPTSHPLFPLIHLSWNNSAPITQNQHSPLSWNPENFPAFPPDVLKHLMLNPTTSRCIPKPALSQVPLTNLTCTFNKNNLFHFPPQMLKRTKAKQSWELYSHRNKVCSLCSPVTPLFVTEEVDECSGLFQANLVFTGRLAHML